jgi:uncharacterized membrane protein
MNFIKTTILGGALFLVPVAILAIVLGKAYQIMMLVAQPMSGWVPIDAVGGIALANLLALAAIILSCFFAGLLARGERAKAVYRSLDRRMTSIPGYAFVKAMTEDVHPGPESGGNFIPVISRFDDNAQISFEIERTPDGQVVVYLPGAPNPWSGSVVLLDQERVQKLDQSASDVIRSIRSLGRGAAKYGKPDPDR